MITVKLGELRGIVEGVNEIGQEKLPVKVAYAFSKVAKKIAKEYQTFEENRMKLVMAHCLKIEKGPVIITAPDPMTGKMVQQFDFDPEEKNKFNQEFAELCNIDLELNTYPVTLSQLGDVQVSPETLVKLEKFIIEDPEPKPKEPEMKN